MINRNNYPTASSIKKYWSLVIIESDNYSNPRLPASLLPANSDYYDRILFVLMGSPSSDLIRDFSMHATTESSKLPPNVIEAKTDYIYATYLIG